MRIYVGRLLILSWIVHPSCSPTRRQLLVIAHRSGLSYHSRPHQYQIYSIYDLPNPTFLAFPVVRDSTTPLRRLIIRPANKASGSILNNRIVITARATATDLLPLNDSWLRPPPSPSHFKHLSPYVHPHIRWRLLVVTAIVHVHTPNSGDATLDR